jgi:DNA-binding CsgD family transcriptional regulator
MDSLNMTPSRILARVIWRALVDGRWCVVQQETKDGKRVLVVRKNRLEARDAAGLRPLERQVLSMVQRGHCSKLIAHELGITPSAVSQRLTSALRKLGLRHASELAHHEARP